jgi:hypothetical protein
MPIGYLKPHDPATLQGFAGVVGGTLLATWGALLALRRWIARFFRRTVSRVLVSTMAP